MNVPFFFIQLFTGQDYWDLNVYVVIILEIVLCHSLAFQVVSQAKQNPGAKVAGGQVAWLAMKAGLAGALAFLSLWLGIGIALYAFLAAGAASARLARRAERKAWKGLHGAAAVLLLLLAPAALFTAGMLLRFTIELLFGIGGVVTFVAANARSFRTPARPPLRRIKEWPLAEKAALVAGVCLVSLAGVTVPAARMTVDEVMLPMRDGTMLATSVYRPAVQLGGLPVILIRTPYSRAYPANMGESWYNKGYIVVIQDVRGTFDSEGTFDALVSGGNDAFDTCEWILAQPWCDGRIGSTGMSALAITQYLAAGAGSPGLVAQAMEFGTADMYDAFFRGGKYAESDIGYWIWLNSKGSNATIDEFLAHPAKDAWWDNASLDIGGDYARVDTRAVHLAGWFDIFQQNTIDAFAGFYYNGTARARGHQKLVIGPWGHGVGSRAGQVPFPDWKDPAFSRWREAVLTEALEPPKLSNALFDVPSLWSEPNIAYYVMGDVLDPSCSANEWRYTNDWPILHVDAPLYLQADGTLAWAAPVVAKNYSYLYDPQHPMQTIGGTNLVFDEGLPYNPASVHNKSIGWGMWDQRPLLNRTDVLVFNTSVLTAPLEVTGRVKARLWISSNCTDTDFVAKLCDVYPTGQSMLVCDGIASVRKRNGLDKDELMALGTAYEIEVDLWSTAYQFNAGHRIQLVVSSSNAPKYQPCPNTGDPIARTYASTAVANNSILVGAAYASRLVLPVVP
ncbi:MAG: CocE/NonD family hydrolase [Candidatus Lokiarchaeota archaeon]|nr:CocE/NonD family hydrolase [Candidatus Lokiarchaeota archaeon]